MDGWWGLSALRSCRILAASCWEFGWARDDFAQSSELLHGTLWLHHATRQLEAVSFIRPGIRRIYKPDKILRKWQKHCLDTHCPDFLLLKPHLLSNHFLRLSFASCRTKEIVPFLLQFHLSFTSHLHPKQTSQALQQLSGYGMCLDEQNSSWKLGATVQKY